MFEEMCAANSDEPACRIFNPQPSGLWCEEKGGNNTRPVLPEWGSPASPNVIYPDRFRMDMTTTDGIQDSDWKEIISLAAAVANKTDLGLGARWKERCLCER